MFAGVDEVNSCRYNLNMNEKDLAHKYANEVAEECLAQRQRAVGRIVSNRDGHRADRRRRLGFSLIGEGRA